MKKNSKSEFNNRLQEHSTKTHSHHHRQSQDKMLIDLGEYLLKVEGVFSRYHHN